MPFILLLFGAVLVVTGIRGTHDDLWELVKGDFTGGGDYSKNKSFGLWIAAIVVVGSVGYIKPLRGFSVAFMSLLVLVLFLSNKGVITQLQGFVNNPAPGTPANSNDKTGFNIPPIPSIGDIGVIANLAGFG